MSRTVDLWVDLRTTFVVDGELFWGQDRIDFVRAKLVA
jgi:2-hydroxychromene-2-carboxylate isomerase